MVELLLEKVSEPIDMSEWMGYYGCVACRSLGNGCLNLWNQIRRHGRLGVRCVT